jgi:uncharacterized membrane protein YkvA (DUF1232 family)
MTLDFSITLSDADLQQFVNARSHRSTKAREKMRKEGAASIIAAARAALKEARATSLPEFVATRLNHLDTIIAMVEDVGFGLPQENLDNALATLAYFSSPEDIVPDNVPILGYLDDAIVIELCARELQPEIDAYEDFTRWRDNEATRRGVSTAGLTLGRVEWAEARREEALERIHRRREESYTGGWAPMLFRVH